MERRDVLKAALALPASLAASMPAFSQAPPSGTRKSVSTLLPNDPDLVQYARAVSALKALPSSDPRNWRKLASVHNDYCPHNNWWFLPWHRAYLFYFEEACRSALGSNTFKLPYWDWTRNPRIPAPFWSGDLADSTRAIGPNTDIPSEFVGSSVIAQIMNAAAISTVYSGSTNTDSQREPSAAGTLEATPHNNVHGSIRGNMGSYMSPLDPIFWLHHANVDRIWTSAVRALPARVPTQLLWRNHALTSFYDPRTNQQVSPKTSDVLDANAWGAVYDNYEAISKSVSPSPKQMQDFAFGTKQDNVLAASKAGLVFASSAMVLVKPVSFKTPQKVSIPVDEKLSAGLESARVSSTRPGESHANLVIEGVPRPAKPTSALRVFLNCKNPSALTPIDDPSYVGTVAFFAHGDAGEHPGHGAGAQETNFILEIGSTLQKLAAVGQYSPSAPLDVALVAVDALNPGNQTANEVLKPTSVRIVAVT